MAEVISLVSLARQSYRVTKKTCSKCKTEKHVDEFAKVHSSSDGRASECKACVSKRLREKYQRKKAEAIYDMGFVSNSEKKSR